MENDITGLEFTVASSNSNSGFHMEESEWYPAKLTNFEHKDDTWKDKPVKKIVWTFELQGEEFSWKSGDGRTGQFKIYGKTSYACSPKSTLYQWYSKLSGAEPQEGDKITLKNLLGMDCFIMVKINKYIDKETKEEKIYHNIEKVKRGKQSTQAEVQTSKPKEVAKVQQAVSKTTTAPVEKVAAQPVPSKSDNLFDDIY